MQEQNGGRVTWWAHKHRISQARFTVRLLGECAKYNSEALAGAPRDCADAMDVTVEHDYNGTSRLFKTIGRRCVSPSICGTSHVHYYRTL